MEIALAGLVAVMFLRDDLSALCRATSSACCSASCCSAIPSTCRSSCGADRTDRAAAHSGGLKGAAAAIANPVPQALVLTAIVISFSFFVFLLVLAYRAYQDLETDDTMEMRVAEPEDEGLFRPSASEGRDGWTKPQP